MKFRNMFGVRYPTAPGLVLDLPCSERSGPKVYDRSGKGNHGTIHGATWAVAEIGAVLSFDGDNDYVGCGNASSLNFSDRLTVMMWLATSATSWYAVVNKWNAQENDGGWSLQGNSTGSKLFCAIVIDGTKRELEGTNYAINDNEWHLGTMTYDGLKIRMYVDAKLDETSSSYPGYITANDFDVGIGARTHDSTPGNKDFFKGSLESLLIFNRALGINEIRRLYEQSKYYYLRAT